MPRRILVVDDLATNRIIMKVKLIGACYESLLARDGHEAVQLARTEQPDLILLDYLMPGLDGLAVTRILRADPRTQAIPIIMISAGRDEEAKFASLRAGVDDFLSKPFDDDVLLARIRNLLRASDQSDELAGRMANLALPGLAEASQAFLGPLRIALVTHRPERAVIWRSRLSNDLPASYTVLTREEAIARGGFDLYFIGAEQGGGTTGLQLIAELRAQSGGRHAVICMIAPPGAQALAAMALDLGANAVMPEDFNGTETALRARHLLERKLADDRRRATVEEGLRMATRDPLTGLYNRRFAMPRLAQMLADATQTADGCAVMLVDIDEFKRINDRFGHATGDLVLTEVSARLRGAFRPDDLIARIGGDEFLIAISGVDRGAATALAERLRRIVAEPIRVGQGQTLDPAEVTVSIGLAIATARQSEAGDVLDLADRALFNAKTRGRNRVSAAPFAAA